MNQNQKPKGAFEGTLDSVSSTVGWLWNFLGAEPTKEEPEPSLLKLAGSVGAESEPEASPPARARCNFCFCTDESGYHEQTCPRRTETSDVIDAEGKEV